MNYDVSVRREDSAPCPSCNSHSLVSDAVCTHCGHEFSAEERGVRDLYIKQSKRKGWILGILFFPVLLGMLIAIFTIFS